MLNTTMPMMSFAFGDNNSLRTHIDENGDPWFMAKDVCTALGLENNRKAVERLNERQKITVTNSDGNPRAGIPHSFTLVSESGLYALSFTSRKPEAKIFCDWVCEDVLPSLRKTGTYSMPNRKRQLYSKAEIFESLPEDIDMMGMRHRKECLHLALQTARIDGGMSIEDVRELFINYCRTMFGEQKIPVYNARDKHIYAFVQSKLVAKKGSRLFAEDIYKALKRDWLARTETKDMPIPSLKSVASILSPFFSRGKSSRSFYHDVAFVE